MVAPVNVEGALVSWLSAGLSGVSVSVRVPTPRPDSFVRVRRLGGIRGNLAQENPLVLFESWAPSVSAAFTLAQRVWALVDAADGLTITSGVFVAETGLTVPVPIDDPDTGTPRYQFTGNMVVNLDLGN